MGAAMRVTTPSADLLAAAERGLVEATYAVLPAVAPEFGEWAEFFAASAPKRSAAEAGLRVVTQREADDLLRDAETFHDQVCTLLHIDRQQSLPATG
jgi:hypothetical protein